MPKAIFKTLTLQIRDRTDLLSLTDESFLEPVDEKSFTGPNSPSSGSISSSKMVNLGLSSLAGGGGGFFGFLDLKKDKNKIQLLL